MAADVSLPPGFTLDQLPEGFKLDPAPQPSRLRKYAEAFLKGGPMGVMTTGAGEALDAVEAGAEWAGGKTTDALASVVPPEAAAAAGTAVKLAPSLVGGGTVKAVGKPIMDWMAKGTMRSALKPDSFARASGDADKAIKTLLDEGATISSAGAAKLRGIVDKLHGEVAKKVKDAGAQGATVDKGYVGSEVYDTLQKFRTQVTPGADTKSVLKAWEEFTQNHGAKIPVEQAQALKQGTYRILADKYAKGGTPAIENEASTQAQMAMARGLRKGVEDVVPGVGAMNARESQIINALELSEKRAGTAGNRDIGGIAWLANHPGAAAAMMADRSPAFKSALAILLHRARGAAPFTAGTAGTAAYMEGNNQ